MSRTAGWTRRALLAVALAMSQTAAAQDMALTRDAEAGFRQLMHRAETGGLGPGISGANIGVVKTQVRIELVSPGAPPRVLLLRRATTQDASSRYFAVEAGDGATPADVAALARALDEIFVGDPFQVMNAEEAPANAPQLSFAEAWKYGGWDGLRHALERRMRARAGRTYAAAAIAALALGLCATVALLWAPASPQRTPTRE